MTDTNIQIAANCIARQALRPAEVAQALGISQDSVRRLVEKGVLTRSRNTRKLTITRQSVSCLLSQATDCGVDVTKELQTYGPRLVVTPREIAGMLRVHEETVHRQIRSGNLPCCPHLGCSRITKRSLDRWLNLIRGPGAKGASVPSSATPTSSQQ